MTPWALENIALYNQYGSAGSRYRCGQEFHFWPPMLTPAHPVGGSGHARSDYRHLHRLRRADHRQVAKLALPSGISRLTSRFCLVCRLLTEPGDVYPVRPDSADSGRDYAGCFLYHGWKFIPPVTNPAP